MSQVGRQPTAPVAPLAPVPPIPTVTPLAPVPPVPPVPPITPVPPIPPVTPAQPSPLIPGVAAPPGATAALMLPTGETGDIGYRDPFPQNNVIILRDADFHLNTRDRLPPLTLKNKDCLVVLFHDGVGRESLDLAHLIRGASQYAPSVQWAAVNLYTERGVGRAIRATLNNPDDPFYHFAPLGLPAIITFRQGNPQAHYNGPRDLPHLVDYGTSLACQAGFRQSRQDRLGIAVPNIRIGGSYLYPPLENEDIYRTDLLGRREYPLPQDIPLPAGAPVPTGGVPVGAPAPIGAPGAPVSFISPVGAPAASPAGAPIGAPAGVRAPTVAAPASPAAAPPPGGIPGVFTTRP
jgi:hypothetical protein